MQSFKTFKIDFSYRSNDNDYLTSVAKLKAWYMQLDEELEAVLETITDEEVAENQMDRGDFTVPLHISLDVYREALLIFYGKVSVYCQGDGCAINADVAGLDCLGSF